MTDPRFKKLAKLLIEYSTALKKGERVLLDMIDVPDEFSVELMRAARAVGFHAPTIGSESGALPARCLLRACSLRRACAAGCSSDPGTA